MEDLLADLDGLSEEEDKKLENENEGLEEVAAEVEMKDEEDNDTEMKDDFQEHPIESYLNDTGDFKLLQSKGVSEILKKISEKINETSSEEDPQYKLVVQANQLAVDIETEIHNVQKFVRDIYCKRFPELEGLVLHSLDYIRAVKAIGNEMDFKKVNLQGILPPSSVMMVSVSASTSAGKPLESEEWNKVSAACDYVSKLDGHRIELLEFVASRMNDIAPNLSILVGPSIAAKLMGSAGGLVPLARIPACNIPILGTVKKTLAGFSSANIQRHAGHLFHCDLIKTVRPELRMKAQRIISAKCTLAARVDSFRESQDGSVGQKLKEDVEKKLEKLMEPPPLKKIKAIPAPVDRPSKKRGGKRARRVKEMYVMTELRKLQNRVAFGQAEEENLFGESVKGMGLISSSSAAPSASGRIRGPAVDAKLSNHLKKVAAKKLENVDNNFASGSATSISFTPVQGFELRNPAMAALAEEEKAAGMASKYFSGGGFIGRKK